MLEIGDLSPLEGNCFFNVAAHENQSQFFFLSFFFKLVWMKPPLVIKCLRGVDMDEFHWLR
uniref:Uncharacterized protein n=1 Tax=Helianthus annuus TaxID=4232 RepID=A0A251U360_HELAN